MLSLLIAATGLTNPATQSVAGDGRWPELKAALCEAGDVIHVDPDCGLLQAPLVDDGYPLANSRTCGDCTRPYLDELATHPAARELEAADTALSHALQADFWAAHTFAALQDPPSLRQLLADPGRRGEARTRLTSSAITHIDIFDAISAALLGCLLSAAHWADAPTWLTDPWATKLRAAEASARRDLALVRSIVDDPTLAALANDTLSTDTHTPVVGHGWCFFTTHHPTDQDPVTGCGTEVGVLEVRLLLEALWPGQVVVGRDGSRFAARVPVAYAMAWLAHRGRGEILAAPGTPEGVRPARASERLPVCPLPPGGLESLEPVLLATALELWHPPTRGVATTMDAAAALVVAADILSAVP